MSSIPEDTTDLEKIRYIYIELGKIFSYDYRIILDESVIDEELDFEANQIARYKTCYQISEILTILINGAVPNAKAKVIERTIDGRRFNREHVATEVVLSDGMKLLLDLTLDLANIQAGMKTKEFGYTTNSTGDYDIISLRECAEMDKKLGFIVEKYTDDYIDAFKEKVDAIDFGDKSHAEIVDYKIRLAKEELFKNFPGCHEATRYVYNVLTKILKPEDLIGLKQYNLSYKNADEFSLISIYAFKNLGLIYRYSHEFGFNKISPEIIQDLLKNGWQTNSQSIAEIFADDKPKFGM